MTNITDMSIKLISYILKYISIEDVINLSLTCKILYSTINDNKTFWRCKFFQRWPSLKEICDRKWATDDNIKLEIIERMKCRKELLDYFSIIDRKYYYRDDLTASDMKDFDRLFRVKDGAHPMKYYYLEDELIAIIDDPREFEKINLTDVYYAKKVLLYMKHCRLTDKWQTFINLPAEQQLLEQAMAITIQWCTYNARVSTSHVTLMLDIYANRILKLLKEENPTHPIHSMCVKKLPCWRHNIDENYWEEMESRQILDAVNTVICFSSEPYEYQKLIFFLTLTNNNEEYKVGYSLCMTVIFHAVARRLGVRCVLFVSPPHIFLTWRESYSAINPNVENYYYIDVPSGEIVRNKYRSLLYEILRASNLSKLCPITPAQLAFRITQYFQSYWKDDINRICLEFRCIIYPQDINAIMELSHWFKKHIINFTDFIPILEKTLTINTLTSFETRFITEALNDIRRRPPLQPPKIEPKQRFDKIKYAVGMIVKIDTSVTSTYGVIFGWNTTVKKKQKTFNSSDRSNVLFVEVMYKILARDHKTISSISQDFVTPLNLEEIIDHYEIGKYFSYFNKNYYVPNVMLEREYPFDFPVRDKWISQNNE